MSSNVFYIDGSSPALAFAAEYLRFRGQRVATNPSENVTHLLLPVPVNIPQDVMNTLLAQLPPEVTVLGGNLDSCTAARKLDLLKDETYLAENAAITADCALRLAGEHLGVVFRQCPVLILGFGRIAKCLAQNLSALGASVTVAARKEADRAIGSALGYHAADWEHLALAHYRLILNTVPAPVLTAEKLQVCRQDCVKIDLASKRGMDGDTVLWARGLPGKMLPESAGKLIGETVLRLIAKEESA